MKTVTIVFQIMLIACLLVSCSINAQRSDTLRSLIFFQGCVSPCWVGITTDKTNFDETKRILETRYAVQNVSIKPGLIEWQANGIDSLKNGSVTLSDEVVNDILLFFNDRHFVVGDMIRVLGEPSNVKIDIAPYVPESQCLGIQLIYPKSGVVVFLDSSENFKGVRKSQYLSGLRLTSPDLLQNLQIYDGLLVEWQGYKDYCQNIYLTPAKNKIIAK